MSIIYSHNVTLDSIFINNTVTSGTAGKILHMWNWFIRTSLS